MLKSLSACSERLFLFTFMQNEKFAMKNLIAIIMFLSIIPVAMAQPASGNAQKNMLEQARAMGDAFVAGKYEEFARYTHPTIEIMMGGKEKLVAEIIRSFEEIKAEGVSFVKAEYGAPAPMLVYEGQLQCTIPQMISLKVDGGVVTANSVLIAVSMDNGSNWYFLDPTGNDIATMRKVVPTLSPKLVIPVSVDPAFEPDENAKP